MSSQQPLGRMLAAMQLGSIKNKIVMLAVMATLIPAVSTAVLSYVQNRRALTDTLEGELTGIGSQSAREIDLWMRDREYDVRVYESSFEVSENLDRILAGGPESIEALSRLTEYLTSIQALGQYYPELFVVDTLGAPVASSREALPTAPIPAEWLPRLRLSESVRGEPYEDEAYGTVVIQIAHPVESTDARFLGALVATLSLDAVQVILRGLAPGEAGSVDLIEREGQRIVGSATDGRVVVVPPDVLEALLSQESGTVEYGAGEGTVLGTGTDVPQFGWAVITQLPTNEAYAQVAELRNSTILLVSGLLVFAGGAAYLLGLFIVRPLARLSVAAASVSRGDLSVDLPVTGGDEVSTLTGAFNRMVSELRRNREELAEASAALREHNVELERLSMTDALTGLYNRRYVMNEMEKEIHRADRHERSMGVLMIDVDKFKLYNDAHGHLAGDEVLNGMGRVLEDATRPHDVPGRFGGEEFIVLLPDCNLQGATDAAERIRARLAEEVFEGGAVTCSIGASAFPEHGDSPPALIAAADAALYEAKDAGRDRVHTAPVKSGEAPPKAEPESKRRTTSSAGGGKPAAEKKAAPKKASGRKGATKVSAPKKKAPPKKKAAKKAPKGKKAAGGESGEEES